MRDDIGHRCHGGATRGLTPDLGTNLCRQIVMLLRQVVARVTDDHGEFCWPGRWQVRGGPVDDPLPVIPAAVI